MGDRRNRKEQNGGSSRKQSGVSRRSSMISSRSTETTGKPSLLNIFTSGSRKPKSERGGSQANNRPEDGQQRRTSSSTTTGSESSGQDLSSTAATTRDSAIEVLEGRDCPSDTEQSLPSERQYYLPMFRSLDTELLSVATDSVFSGWTEKSSRTDSSWSSVIDTSTLCSGTSNCVVQPLSPTSYVTQSTEVTVAPRDTIKVEEQTATIVRISAAPTLPVQVQNIPDSPSKM